MSETRDKHEVSINMMQILLYFWYDSMLPRLATPSFLLAESLVRSAGFIYIIQSSNKLNFMNAFDLYHRAYTRNVREVGCVSVIAPVVPGAICTDVLIY